MVTKTTTITSQLNAANVLAKPPVLKAAAGVSQGKANPAQGFEGPSPVLPGVETPGSGFIPKTADDRQTTVNGVIGTVSQADAIKTLMGGGSGTPATPINPARAAVDSLTNLPGSVTNMPSFDQGFNTPISVGANPGNGANPMAPYQGGSVGGLLGAAAAVGAKSLADMGKSGLFSIEAKSAEKAGSAAAKVAGGAAFVETVTGGGTAAVIKETALVGRVFAVSQAGVTAAGAVAAVAGAFAAGVGAGTLLNEAATMGLSAYTGKDNYTLGDLLFDVVHPDDDASAAKPAQGGSVSIPDPDSQGVQVSVLSGAILNQRRAARAGQPTSNGGSGDATPVDDGGMAVVGNNGSIAVNQGSINGRNLLGQPGNPGGENVRGGNRGLNTFGGSNGAGVINPGPDGGIPGGDPRFTQDPLGGNQPAPPSTPTPRSSQDSQSSSVNTTLAEGVRNLTLTGAARINGTGNALDNVINGNGNANVLRGGAGNDALNGRAGNDILDGGTGRDVLTGGVGADRFRFTAPRSFGAAQADRITDFTSSEGDRIEISRRAFGLSAGATVSFQAVNSAAELNRALGSTTLLIQDLRNGSLVFNQNGAAAGMGQGGVFAQVSQGLSLGASDFTLLA